MDAAASTPLFEQVLGTRAFDALPPTVRRLHAREGCARYKGEVEVTRGTGLLSRICAAMTRLPPAGRGPIDVEIESRHGRETWVRHVRGQAMRSTLRGGDGVLVERLGPVEFAFRLRNAHGAILWTVAKVRLFGAVPLPTGWFSDVQARESERDGRYCFEVSASLPLAGLLVRYTGWLHVD